MDVDRRSPDEPGQDSTGMPYVEDDQAMEEEERRDEQEAEQAVRD